MKKDFGLVRTKRNIPLLVFLLFSLGLSSCTPTTIPEEAVENPVITPTKTIDYQDWNQSVIGEGKHPRSEFCMSSFSFQSRTLGLLTVAISDNLPEAGNIEGIYRQVFLKYDQMIKGTQRVINNPITIFIIPESIKELCVSNNTDIYTTPDMIGSISLGEEIIGASTNVVEYWVKAGLAFIASGAVIDNQVLKEWYQETEDLDILGLFIARFSTDWVTQGEVDIARMTAASLIEYYIENEEIPIDKIGTSINNDLRNRWMQFIGVSRSVNYSYDDLYESFIFSKSENCSLVAESEEIYFCLNRLPDQIYFNTVNDAEDFISRVFNDYHSLTDYLQENAPSVTSRLDPRERIVIEISKLGVPLGYTDGKTIRINNSAVIFDVLHEIVHTYDWNYRLIFGNHNLLLGEGYAEYLGKYFPIGDQAIKKVIWEDITGRESSPGISYWYSLDEEQLSAAKEWYLLNGGNLNSEESIDPRRFVDAIAFATMYRDAHGGSMGIPIGEKYERLENNLDTSEMDGLELSYTQAASYTAWLSDAYTLDTVLDYFVNRSTGTSLEDKEYADLKVEWLAYLTSAGETIQIPNSP